MRRGILSDEAIKRMYPEHFPTDFRTHQIIYEGGVDIPKHKLTGIKRSKTAHQHLKTKPRYPLHDLFLHSQAVAPLNPSVKSSVGAYRRAIGDALERDCGRVPRFHWRILLPHFKYPKRPQYAVVVGKRMSSALMINMETSWPSHEWTHEPKSLSSWQD